MTVFIYSSYISRSFLLWILDKCENYGIQYLVLKVNNNNQINNLDSNILNMIGLKKVKACHFEYVF